MLSTFPVNTLSCDYLLPTPFPVYEPDLPPWEWQEPPAAAFVFPLEPDQEPEVPPKQPPQEHLISDSDSGSDTSKPNQAISSSGSDDREPNDNNSKPNHKNSRTMLADERKRKRMISNRESARRSRMRRKTHLDNLMYQLNQLRVENRVLANRLRSVTHRCVVLQTNNEQIRADSSELRQRLWDIRRQELLVRQHLSSSAWACGTSTPI